MSLMPRARIGQAAVVAALWHAGCGGSAPVAFEPLPGGPPAQQRTITRKELGYQWPFTVGVGTIGCDHDILAFRSGGTTYGLNRGVGTRGYANVDDIRRVQGSGPPSDPVAHLTQDARIRVFAETSACAIARNFEGSRRVSDCKARLRQRPGVSESELIRIEAEGVVRNWASFKPVLMKLDGVIATADQPVSALNARS